jgi:hypothetical protein
MLAVMLLCAIHVPSTFFVGDTQLSCSLSDLASYRHAMYLIIFELASLATLSNRFLDNTRTVNNSRGEMFHLTQHNCSVCSSKSALMLS